ncbi:hypothetical protein B7494_g7146 [Chlorociboria aeruginascens]|nr:hypothetical protein B7494_g7146 [Chlorociboria aeruginascens]
MLSIQNEASNSYIKKLKALTKLYTEKNKYNGDIGGLTFKLTIFHNFCRKAGVSSAVRAMAFFTMLKGRALNYYYSNGELEEKEDQNKADLDTFEALLINISDDEDAFKDSIPKQTFNFMTSFGPFTLEQAVYATNLLVDRATDSIGSICVPIPIGLVEFHVIDVDTPFLLCLADIDRLGIYYNNIKNVLVTSFGDVPTLRRFGHAFLIWDDSFEPLRNTFNKNDELPLRNMFYKNKEPLSNMFHKNKEPLSNIFHKHSTSQSNIFHNGPIRRYDLLIDEFCFLTETELRQLHRRFGHPSIERLRRVLERSGHDVDTQALQHLTKYCAHCQKHRKSPGRFRFAIKDDIDFNYSILVDIFYINNKPVLYIVDESTGFQAGRWLKDISAKHVKDFKYLAAMIKISTKAVSVEAYWSIGKVERYYIVIRRAYQIISEELPDLDKDIALQMAFKAVNDTAGPNGLVPTLLVFGAYLRMLQLDAPAPTIAQRFAATKKAIDEDKEDSQLPTAPPPAAPSSTNTPAEGSPTRDPAAELVKPTILLPRRRGRPCNNIIPVLPADISIYLEDDLTLPPELLSKSPTESLLIKGYNLYLRNILQAYVQSTTKLNRNFYVCPPKKLKLANETILKVIKPFYGIPEADNHWFKIYHQYHVDELQMTQSTYDPCLLYTNSLGFGFVGLQTDDTFFISDITFAASEQSKLKFQAKDREMLTTDHPLKFNKRLIALYANYILFNQER